MSIGRVPGNTGIQPSIVDAKGDLIAATAADSVSRLAVGTNNQVLMAASGEATGVKWANEATATLTTTGDILYASSANTPARLGIGSSSQVLTVSGGVPSWATAVSGGMTSIASGSLSGSSVDLTSISGSYKDLQLIVRAYRPSADTDLKLRFNSDSNTRYRTIETNSTANDFNLTFMRFCNSSQDSVTGQGIFVANIYDYANTTTWKIAETIAMFNNGTTATNVDYFSATSVYNQTSAITAISIFPSSGTFSAGTYVLYGVS